MRGRGEGSIRRRQRKDGSVFWVARVSIHGRQKSFCDDTKSGATALARQARADAERGKGVSLDSLSVESYLLDWLETSTRPRVRARTYKSYRASTSERTARWPALTGRTLDWCFAGPTGGIRDGNAVTRNFKARLERRDIEPIRWHALRRVFAAVLQDQGVPLERIRDLMGHSELRVTETYAYTMQESLDRDMGTVDQALGNPLDGSSDDESPPN